MSLSITEVRQALADAIRSPDLGAYSHTPEKLNTPCATVAFAGRAARKTLADASGQYQFTVTLWTTRAEVQAAVERIDRWVSPEGYESIQERVEQLDRIGSYEVSVSVLTVGPEQAVAFDDGSQYVTVDFEVEVLH